MQKSAAHPASPTLPVASNGKKLDVPALETWLWAAAVDAKHEAEMGRAAALDALFKSLLHHLMTGKVRLPGFGGASDEDPGPCPGSRP